MKKLCVLTGAGISAESGIKTFRGSGGLWEGHKIEDVASPQGWAKNPEMVLDFYNKRRSGVRKAQPNRAHKGLVDLEDYFDVQIVTQNIDDLHERAGSSQVLHLHGEILKACSSSGDKREVYNLNDRQINIGDTCENGTQLRPFIVWFGEAVPKIQDAIDLCIQADVFVVIGTSLAVYPAAGLVEYTKNSCVKYIIDPNLPEGLSGLGFKAIPHSASEGVDILKDYLLKEL